MPDSCCVVGCSNRRDRDKVSCFIIPSNKDQRGREDAAKTRRRQKWLSAINRSDLEGTKLKNAKVCAKHFISGKPAALEYENHPDWAPSQNLGYGKSNGQVSPTAAKKPRYIRHEKRNRKKLFEEKVKVTNTFKNTDPWPDVAAQHSQVDSNFENTALCGVTAALPVCEEDEEGEAEKLQKQLQQMQIDSQQRNAEIYKLKSVVSNYMLDEESFRNDDNKTLFYTGLPSFFLFNKIVALLEPEVLSTQTTSLTVFQQVLLTLMKLRLNLLFTDLGYRFQIHRTTASRYFYRCLDILYYKLRRFIRWPTREELRSTMPSSFQKHFEKRVAVIMDCFEIYIERASTPDAKAQTWSQYKHHNTIKFLICICPQGYISFISKAYGGRASDKFITEDCNVLSNLLPGDVVLADRGFNITEAVKLYMAEVQTPTFLKGKSQLHPRDVEETRHLANVRIHVERVIGVLRQKYTILFDGNLPIQMLVNYANENVQVIDKVVTVCCALTNLCPSVVDLQ